MLGSKPHNRKTVRNSYLHCIFYSINNTATIAFLSAFHYTMNQTMLCLEVQVNKDEKNALKFRSNKWTAWQCEVMQQKHNNAERNEVNKAPKRQSETNTWWSINSVTEYTEEHHQ